MESAAAAEASWNGCASARGRRGQKCRVFRYLLNGEIGGLFPGFGIVCNEKMTTNSIFLSSLTTSLNTFLYVVHN